MKVAVVANASKTFGKGLPELRRVLERAGIEFIQENGGGAGVRLRKRQRRLPLISH